MYPLPPGVLRRREVPVVHLFTQAGATSAEASAVAHVCPEKALHSVNVDRFAEPADLTDEPRWPIIFDHIESRLAWSRLEQEKADKQDAGMDKPVAVDGSHKPADVLSFADFVEKLSPYKIAAWHRDALDQALEHLAAGRQVIFAAPRGSGATFAVQRVDEKYGRSVAPLRRALQVHQAAIDRQYERVAELSAELSQVGTVVAEAMRLASEAFAEAGTCKRSRYQSAAEAAKALDHAAEVIDQATGSSKTAGKGTAPSKKTAD